MDTENNNSHLQSHNTKNIAMLNDAKKSNTIVHIDGKDYIKVRIWVHELERLTGDLNDVWAEVNDDFIKQERIPLLEAKIQKLEDTILSLQQFNKTQEYEYVFKLRSLQKTIKNRQQDNEDSDVKLLKLTDEYNIQLRSWKKRMQKINKKNENLLIKLDKSIYNNHTLQNIIQNINGI